MEISLLRLLEHDVFDVARLKTGDGGVLCRAAMGQTAEPCSYSRPLLEYAYSQELMLGDQDRVMLAEPSAESIYL